MRILLAPRSTDISGTGTAQPGLRLNLPVRVGSGSTLGASSRQREVLRVVAAAAAVASPQQALIRVEAARDKRSDVIAPVLAKGDLDEVVAAIDAARKTPSTDAVPDEVAAAARAVGANARLVQAAHSVLSDAAKAATLTKALDWVAAVDPSLLDRAASAGSSEKLLDQQVPTPEQQQTDALKALEAKVDGVVAGVAAIDGRLQAIEAGVTALDGRVQRLEGAVGGLEGRVSKLEAGGGYSGGSGGGQQRK